MSERPPRPTSMDDLRFARARMYDWLGPLGLVLTGAQAGISTLLSRYADKRETEGEIPQAPCDLSREDEVWVDFVADIGDGFDPTYAVARELARTELELGWNGERHVTKRGRLLVLGGDLAYPVASEKAWFDKFIGPYEAALPWSEDEAKAPLMYAIPGNHDWYDGLTTFVRLFCQGEWVGGWRTEQRRSYFAVKLPNHWWLLGVDIQFNTYIDEPQLTYFRGLPFEPGDRIILCTGTPSWVRERLMGDEKYKGATEARRNLSYFEASVVRARGGDVRIVLAGDLHHYARYESAAGRQRITAGGGGAYLYPTHVLFPRIEWQDHGVKPDPAAPKDEYRRREIYPGEKTSKSLRNGAFLVPRNSRSFMWVPAVVSLLTYWTVLFSLTPRGRHTVDVVHATGWWHLVLALVRTPVGAVLLVVLLGGFYGFADAVRFLQRLGMALAHGVAQVAAVVSVIWGAARIPFPDRWWAVVISAVLVVIGGALAGSLVFGAYLVMSQWFKRHPNENFASQHIADYKNFIRMRIASDGVTIFPIAIDSVPRGDDWGVVADGKPSDPYIEAERGGSPPRLIEKPVRLATEEIVP